MAERRDNKNRKLRPGEYQRSDGRYAYRYKDCNGIERWLYSWKLVATDSVPEGRTADICLRDMELKATRANLDGVNTYDADRTTLNQCFENYMATKSKLKPHTRSQYRRVWSWYIEKGLGQRAIGSIRYSDILRLYADLIDKQGLSEGTVKNVNFLLRPLFARGIRDGLIRINPTVGVVREVCAKRDGLDKQEKALTTEQQEVLLEFLRSHEEYRRWYRVIIFLLGTGCRIGELKGLTWSDCDFESKIILINRQVGYYQGENDSKHREHVGSPKTKCGARIIPMFNSVRDVLLEEKEWQDKNGYKSRTIDGVSGFIFINHLGGCIDDGNLNRIFCQIVSECNEWAGREVVPRFSAHSLRHTFCTRMCENESNIKVIQEVMGHADISTTMNVYAAAQKNLKQRVFESLEGKIV